MRYITKNLQQKAMKLPNSEITQKLTSTFLKFSCLSLIVLMLCSHDLYVKMETYFLQPNQKATLSLYNGTFEKSENIITRDRMLDASIVAHGKREAINPSQWQDKDSTITQLHFKTGNAGTYVAGVSTKARNIALTAEKFNSYLKHDGVLDMLEYRTKNDLLANDAVESYQKHVKAMYQVGDTKTDDWKTVLGYPIEFIPQENPYETYTGETLEVQLLLNGQPLSNQLVYANHISGKNTHSHDDKSHAHTNGTSHSHDHKHAEKEHSHSHINDEKHSHAHNSEEEHTHTSGQQLRTNAQGMVTVHLPEDGIYYLRTIHMTEVTDNPELTHESKWATLTFEASHKHDSSTHTHNDEHQHEEEGIPMWIFIVGSLVVIGLLFVVFRKKS